MSFTQQELELMKKLRGEGKTPSEIAGAVGASRLGVQSSLDLKNQIKSTPVYKSRFLESLKETAGDISETVFGVKDVVSSSVDNIIDAEMKAINKERNPVKAGLDIAGETIAGVTGTIGELFIGGGKIFLDQEQEEKITKGFQDIAQDIADTEEVQAVGDWYNSLDEDAKQDVRTALNIGEGIFEAATAGGGLVVTRNIKNPIKQAVSKIGKGAIETTEQVSDATIKITDDLVNRSSGLIKPKKEALETVKEVLQGKPDDLRKGVESLSVLDLSNIKTYDELGSKIDDKIRELSDVVDVELSKDQSKYLLDDLVTEVPSSGGELIKTNNVKRALEHLAEHYTKSGDDVKLFDIQELTKLANTEGLTRKQVNDISRIYNQDMRSAFSKTGEPLTSISAQLHENTRSGLKEVARKGIGGNEAKAADHTISSLYNTKRLVDKNIEKVNNLRQKIQNRGLLEKVGNGISKYLDVLTGGTVRGLVGGLLPRGAGYKTMNFLDLEERLAKNLRVVNDALSSQSDDEIIKILKDLEIK